jgi:hypothetical protein
LIILSLWINSGFEFLCIGWLQDIKMKQKHQK